MQMPCCTPSFPPHFPSPFPSTQFQVPSLTHPSSPPQLPSLPPQLVTSFHGGGRLLISSPQSMAGGKQNTLHSTGDLVCQAPACSLSSSSSKMLFYSCLLPLLKTVGCCLAPVVPQPSHIPHLKHFQQPQDMLAYQTASL